MTKIHSWYLHRVTSLYVNTVQRFRFGAVGRDSLRWSIRMTVIR